MILVMRENAVYKICQKVSLWAGKNLQPILKIAGVCIKKTEKNSEAKIRALLAVGIDSSFLADTKGFVEIINKPNSYFFGHKLSKLIGKAFFNFIPQEQLSEWRSKFAVLLSSGKPVSFETECDDRWYITNLYPVMLKGEVSGVSLCFRDVTEQRQCLTSLRKTSDRLKTAEKLAHLGYFEWNSIENSYLWSGETAHIFGFAGCKAPEDNDILKRIYPDDVKAFLDTQRQVIETGEVQAINCRIITKNGSVRYINTISRPYFNDNNEITRIFSTVLDITEQKRTEEALELAREQAEKANSVKSYFLAAASHDLRQPLQALNLFADALFNEKLSERAKMLSEKICVSSEALGNLLNNILDISQIESGSLIPKSEVFSIGKLLESLVCEYQPAASQKNLDLRLFLPKADVYGDAVLVERIVRNLLTNAIHYTNEGGILIGCRYRANNRLLLEVWDTGVGVQEEQRNMILEEFYQVDNKVRSRKDGVGLGLAISNGLAKLIGTHIQMRSRAGKGSVFSFELPIVKQQKYFHEEKNDCEFDKQKPSDSSIAVIDDDVEVLDGIVEILELEGYSVFSYASAKEAIKKLGEKTIDMIIADYRLDDSFTGFELIEKIQNMYNKKIPSMVLTGDLDSELIINAEMQNILIAHKPLSASSFIALVKESIKI